MNRFRQIAIALVVPAVIGGALATLAIYGVAEYGLTLFFATPFVVGYTAGAYVAIYSPGNHRNYITATFAPLILLAFAFLIFKAEGIICVVIAAPLDVVWQRIINLGDVKPANDWMDRAGLACPQRTRILKRAPGGLRVCTPSTGTLVERIVAWRPGRVLRWRSLSVPPPMKETNPFYDAVDAPHLHGYYDAPYGEFALENLGPDRTRVIRRTWYTQRLYPSAYWDFWCEVAISHVHETVLRPLSESQI